MNINHFVARISSHKLVAQGYVRTDFWRKANSRPLTAIRGGREVVSLLGICLDRTEAALLSKRTVEAPQQYVIDIHGGDQERTIAVFGPSDLLDRLHDPSLMMIDSLDRLNYHGLGFVLGSGIRYSHCLSFISGPKSKLRLTVRLMKVD